MAIDLFPGDSITAAATLAVTINGDSAWIKLEVHGKVQTGETGEQAYHRVNSFIQDKVMHSIESTANTVINYDNKEKN